MESPSKGTLTFSNFKPCKENGLKITFLKKRLSHNQLCVCTGVEKFCTLLINFGIIFNLVVFGPKSNANFSTRRPTPHARTFAFNFAYVKAPIILSKTLDSTLLLLAENFRYTLVRFLAMEMSGMIQLAECGLFLLNC